MEYSLTSADTQLLEKLPVVGKLKVRCCDYIFHNSSLKCIMSLQFAV